MKRSVHWAALAVPMFAGAALAVDPVLIDNFANGVVEDSDGNPAFWSQRLSGDLSSATESGGALRLAAGGSAFPHGQVSSLTRPDFNFFRAPIVVQGSGLGFTSPTSSLNKGIFRVSLSSRTIFPEAPVPPAPVAGIDDSEYWADDVLALRIESGAATPGRYSVALGIKENYPQHNSEYDGFWLFNPIINSSATFPGPIRNFRLVYSPLFWNLAITHDASPTDPTPVTAEFNGAVDQFMVNWEDPSDLGPLTGDSALTLQAQLNNAGTTEQATAALDQLSVGQLRQSWQGGALGVWSNAANWSDQDILHVNGDGAISSVPNFAGANVRFGETGGPVTIVTDFDQTLGSMLFDSASGYTIQPDGLGQGTLQMATRWLRNEIRALQGSHAIASPIYIYNNTDVDVAAGARVNLGGQMVDASGIGTLALTKTGAGTAGMLNLRLYDVSVAEGTLQVLPGAGPNTPESAGTVFRLNIGPSGTLDLTNNALVWDYNGDSPLAQVRDWLRSGLTGGVGIVTSVGGGSWRVGYVEGSELSSGSFAGQTVDGSSVVLAYALAGDTNLDGQVDVTDLGRLASNWQGSALWTGGDTNYDGLVDVSDLGDLATNWQAGVTGPSAPGLTLEAALRGVGLAGVVPEPGTLSLAAIAALALRRRR